MKQKPPECERNPVKGRDCVSAVKQRSQGLTNPASFFMFQKSQGAINSVFGGKGKTRQSQVQVQFLADTPDVQVRHGDRAGL